MNTITSINNVKEEENLNRKHDCLEYIHSPCLPLGSCIYEYNIIEKNSFNGFWKNVFFTEFHIYRKNIRISLKKLGETNLE